MVRYGVVINARNESNTIGHVLESLVSQNMPPSLIIVCNDGSTDNTKEIAQKHGAVVIDFPYKHENWITSPKLAHTINMPLSAFDEYQVDFILHVGADHCLPKDYVKRLSTMMLVEPSVVIASGTINGEKTWVVPRGSGRLISYKFFKSVGLRYPIIYGWESWILHKAKEMGFDYKVYDIPTNIDRPTGTNHTKEAWKDQGRAFKALGYTRRFVLGKAILITIKKGQVCKARDIVKGFNENTMQLSEPKLRKHTKYSQNELFKIQNTSRLIKRILNSN